ncbi:hypothetical protein [Streptomyces tirandamycinicus]|uniref:Uncharacterized protein n=1 Tax=Streptomyces tirandamycinicus TaxID=2174846 RepID=A0A2S1T270_9ACTN|nr:hypothetical protein [Streptomyces tirandamycinicus]AWI32676.1 hypothetical protein DDW44_30640 [Streptomyces tirandamycinicus]
MLLLAGTEKSGKSYEAAAFSGSDLIGRTFWIEIGEGEGHHYGAVPGARYELVPHDGSLRDILDAVRWAVWQPRGEDGKPNAIVLDSVSVLWELLGDEQAVISRRRAAERAARQKQPAPTDPTDYTITTDQWNVAKKRWGLVIDALRHHDGPVILCARMDEVTLFDAAGQPTKDRTWKIQAEKKLPFEVTGTLQLRGYRRAFLTGMRSLTLNITPDKTVPYPGFSLDKLMRDLGLHELEAAPRTYVAPQPEAYVEEHDSELARLADRNNRSREARQNAAQGQLPDPEAVSRAIRAAFESRSDKRRELVKVRAHYGASVLAQVVVSTPWGEMDANAAIDTALLNIEPATPGEQAGRPQPSGPAPAALPLDADEIERRLAEALSAPDAEQRLHTMREEYGAAPLAQTVVQTEWGTVDANSAITMALMSGNERQSAGSAPAPAPEPAPQQSPPVEPPAPPAPRTAPRRASMTAEERARANMIAELELQAQMLGMNTTEFVADLLPAGATSVEDIRGGSRLQDHIRGHRAQVLAAFTKRGMAQAAAEYAKFGDRVPARNINQFITGVLQGK